MSPVAILIVNGGEDPPAGRWLELCLRKVLENTQETTYQLYIWNNNYKDPWVHNFLQGLPNVTLVQADPSVKLAHPHAVPLQKLYELARMDGAHYIVTLDSDAHPIHPGWLQYLIQSLEHAALAGVWRDELQTGIAPYVHPSCLCSTVNFIENNNLRLDNVALKKNPPRDTLSIFTEIALATGQGICKLERSNKNNYHRLMGGIYGDMIYHHGAGSRRDVSFWDEKRSREIKAYNQAVRDTAARLLFEHYDEYIAWLGDYGTASQHAVLLETEDNGRQKSGACVDIDRSKQQVVRVDSSVKELEALKNGMYYATTSIDHLVPGTSQKQNVPLPVRWLWTMKNLSLELLEKLQDHARRIR